MFHLFHFARATHLRRLCLISTTILLGACASQPPGPSSASPSNEPGTVATPSAPITPEQQTLLTLVAQQDRLDRVAAPLLTANAELCKGQARNLLGFTAKNKYSYPNEYAEAAQQALGLDERLQVIEVLPGSGAAKAGIQRGAILVSVNDKPLPQGPNAERQAASILAPLVSGRTSVTLTVSRNGATQTVTIPLTQACGFRVELGNADHVNAYADGRRLMVTRGMLDFAQSDNELAYVLAHEMAHNALGHAVKQRMSATLGGIIDNLIRIKPDLSGMAGTAGVRPYPQELDGAADVLSLYMLARAGYDIERASHFWQRLANQYPAAVLNGYTHLHPSTAARVATIDKTVAEIKVKKGAKQALIP